MRGKVDNLPLKTVECLLITKKRQEER